MKKVLFGGFMALVVAALGLVSCESQPTPGSLTIDKEVALYVDSTYQIEAQVSPESVKSKINWKSSDTAVVTVNTTGLIKGIKKGSAVITANVGNEIAVCNVQVFNNPVTLELKMVDIAQKKCTVAVKPSDAEGYYYCGYAPAADIAKMSDEQLANNVVNNLLAIIKQYAAYGMSYTLKDVLQHGEKNLIASGLTANTDYVMMAFGVDVETEKPGKIVTRLPFKTKAVVPSTMTFKISLDSIAKVEKVTKGDTTYTYTGVFKCEPSNEKETYIFNGATAQILDSLYENNPMKFLTEMEAYYDANYASQGGFEGIMAKAGVRSLNATKMVHGTKYIIMAAGYSGGYTTDATTFEYTFICPDSVQAPTPVYRAPMNLNAEEMVMKDFRGYYFPGVCH